MYKGFTMGMFAKFLTHLRSDFVDGLGNYILPRDLFVGMFFEKQVGKNEETNVRRKTNNMGSRLKTLLGEKTLEENMSLKRMRKRKENIFVFNTCFPNQFQTVVFKFQIKHALSMTI